jgi:hypothetical protein
MPGRKRGSGGRPGKTSRRARRANANDLMVIASTKTTSAAEVSFPKEDFFRRMGSWILTQTPPRVLSNQIYWIQGKVETGQTISASVPTEVNFAFHFSDLTNLVGIAAFFDQYCIYSVVMNINFNYSGTTPSGLGTCFTAIDFDNIANLGSATAIEAYESCLTTKVTSSQSIQRLVHPTVAPALYSGSAFTNFGISRMWVDCANTGTPHYGMRSYFISNVGTTLTANFDFNFVVGLRNNI